MDCKQVIAEYLKWIKDNTVVRTIEEGKVCSISTPFLDRHNDHLDIYMLKNNGIIKLTDNGYTIADLKMSGFEINTPKRESILKITLNGFGVKMNGNDELYVEATAHNVGQKNIIYFRLFWLLMICSTLHKKRFTPFSKKMWNYISVVMTFSFLKILN